MVACQAYCDRPLRWISDVFLGCNDTQTWQEYQRLSQTRAGAELAAFRDLWNQTGRYGFVKLSTGILIIHKPFFSHLNLSLGQALSSSLSCSHAIRKLKQCHVEPLPPHCLSWATTGVQWAIFSHLKTTPASYFRATQKVYVHDLQVIEESAF